MVLKVCYNYLTCQWESYQWRMKRFQWFVCNSWNKLLVSRINLVSWFFLIPWNKKKIILVPKKNNITQKKNYSKKEKNYSNHQFICRGFLFWREKFRLKFSWKYLLFNKSIQIFFSAFSATETFETSIVFVWNEYYFFLETNIILFGMNIDFFFVSRIEIWFKKPI